MKLKEYAQRINELLEDGNGDLQVVYSPYSEGYPVARVYCKPDVGHFDDANGEFTNKADDYTDAVNAVCIN